MPFSKTVVLAARAISLPATAAKLPHRNAAPVLAQHEDFRRAAGMRIADTLTASLSVREVRWRPEGRAGAELSAFAFVEDGQPAKVPGPLLRAPAGTLVRVALYTEFIRDTVVQQWRSVATDGAELPASQQTTSAAQRTVSAGQTFDVEVTIPDGGPADYALRFRTSWYPTDSRGALPPPILRVPIVVRQR